ncbi:MAG: TauD/TfdA family dioxygenase [Alphaproteobacteria bacterium]|jgi:taurine dioxygenase|nr:TauD/TfdA family dioxygenase [Alphaproteobacteria bacterium]
MVYRHIEVRPIAGALGAEIGGVDLKAPLEDAVFGEIHQAFLEHLVVFFHGADLAPGEQREFAARFGAPNRYPFAQGVDGHPDVIEIVKMEEETENFGGGWHSDTTYLERPPKATCLQAKVVPPVGGDTLFANMYLAYEALSAGMKAMLEGLVLQNSASLKGRNPVTRFGFQAMAGQNEDKAEETYAEHPVVRTHPETGRRALYLNRLHSRAFKGMTETESAPLIDYLCSHAVKPEFTCRFTWGVGSIALWDNRCAMHNPINDYQGQRRVMHRITIEGERPV